MSEQAYGEKLGQFASEKCGQPFDPWQKEYADKNRAHRRKVGVCVTAVVEELAKAEAKHGQSFGSAHEGISVIREEFEELWAHVKADTGFSGDAYKEAKQLAAMAVKYMLMVAEQGARVRGTDEVAPAPKPAMDEPKRHARGVDYGKGESWSAWTTVAPKLPTEAEVNEKAYADLKGASAAGPLMTITANEAELLKALRRRREAAEKGDGRVYFEHANTGGLVDHRVYPGLWRKLSRQFVAIEQELVALWFYRTDVTKVEQLSQAVFERVKALRATVLR